VTTIFSDDDFEQLEAWLQRRRTGIFDIVVLEGFLTAVVIGPNTISPMLWLPKVWGKGKPQFKDLEELNRFVALVMGLYNEIAGCFEQDPAAFKPSFYERPLNDETVIIVDEWCEGFIKGMRVDTEGWKPLKRERRDLLKPMELFGTRAGWRKLRRRAAKPRCTRRGRCASRRPCARSMPSGYLTGGPCRRRQRMPFDTDGEPCTVVLAKVVQGLSGNEILSGVGQRLTAARRSDCLRAPTT
jgi:yecA family protein